MMALLDGTHADAKRSLTFGEAAAARQGGDTLAGLGRLLSAYEDNDQWRSLAAGLTESARALGESKADDPAAIRAALRAMHEKCDACHNQRR